MDASLRELLDSYISGFKMYLPNLPEDHTVKQEANQLISNMESLAESSKDYMGFMQVAQEQDLFNKIIALQSTLAAESSKVMTKDLKNKKIPTALEIAKAYHLAYDAISEDHRTPEVKQVYETVFNWEKNSQSGPEFLMHMEEEDLFLQMSRVHLASTMRKGLKDMLEAGSEWTSSGLGVISNPQLEKYFDTMEEAMSSAKTLLEMEILAIREAENSRFSNLWDTVFIQSILLELVTPISAWKMAKTEANRLNVVTSYEYLCGFWGMDWDGFFEVPRAWDFFEKSIFRSLEESLKNLGINSVEDFKNDLKSCLDTCLKGKTIHEAKKPSKHIVNFRGKEIPLTEVMDALSSAHL